MRLTIGKERELEAIWEKDNRRKGKIMCDFGFGGLF